MTKQTNYGDGGISFNRLPVELWWQILSLLPVKTLLVLRAVCKSFLSVVSDPDFASFHLRRFPDNALRTRLLTVQSYSDNTWLWFEACSVDSTSRTIIEDGIIYETTERKLHFWSCITFLDGLVLLPLMRYYSDDDYDGYRAVLWNPSLRKHRQLSPPTPELGTFTLGCHKSANVYKVVAIGEDGAWVYSVKMASWTGVTLASGLRRGKFGGYNYIRSYYDCLAFDQGVVWIEREFLIFFDFGTERLRYADEMFYPADHDADKHSGLMMLDGGSSVGIWGTDLQDQPSIWALQADSMSWTKRYKISRQLVQYGVYIDQPSFVEMNGELMWKYLKLDHGSLEVLSYDIGTQGIKTHLKF